MSLDEDLISGLSPTKENSKSIQAIDKEAVHRICSGQVVLNLATAVKELVENSLDAGATSIEIRLREYGSELVEVIDNGCGVEESNFQGLTLKHHTSKLREFSDLLGVETFGFRGEALSSLCALSELTVTTRHSSSDMGSRMTYDSRGSLVNKIPCARQVGTTIALANLFSPLPVRQKEFLRNLKREFLKMGQLLHAYCLISTGVKILCTNQTKKGGKSIVVSTQGSPSYKGNIMCVFGAKQAASLLDIEMQTPSVCHLEEIGLSDSGDATKRFQLEGFISSCAHGQGRSATDRQFYYINNRPCDPSKVAKMVNEVYHQYNVHQFPFVLLNIKIARDSVDVNVTPDKRQIFFDNEKLLVATVKASLLKLFENIPNTYQIQNVAIVSSTSTSSFELRDTSPLSSSPLSSSTLSSLNKSCSLSSLLKNFSHSHSSVETRKGGNLDQIDLPCSNIARGVKRPLSSHNLSRDGKKQLCLSDFVSQKKESIYNVCPDSKDMEVAIHMDLGKQLHSSDQIDKPTPHLEIFEDRSSNDVQSDLGNNLHANELQGFVKRVTQCSSPVSDDNIGLTPIKKFHETDSSHNSEDLNSGTRIFEIAANILPVIAGNEKKMSGKTVTLNVNMDKVRNLFLHRNLRSKGNDVDCTPDGKPRIRFYAEIDPSKNKNAEQELKKEISKDMFQKMEIIGQFNLGFIITKLGHDLFIVDQHATDEKYNFETLQTQYSLKNQKLVLPQALELTAVNECILLDNIDIFEKNGFGFIIDKDAEATKRVKLAAKPISHNWEFGKEDIDELLFMLQDSPHTMCRPSRVRAMFASRACRKSVMIGTALSKTTMRQLINHMGEIEQPWNCPHGRPTMRHLVNLELISKR